MLVYRKIIDFQIFILYLTLYPKSFSVDTFIFPRYIIISSVNNDDLMFSSLIVKLLSLLIYFIALSGRMLNKNGSSRAHVLLILQGMCLKCPQRHNPVVVVPRALFIMLMSCLPFLVLEEFIKIRNDCHVLFYIFSASIENLFFYSSL